ncbi:MAG: hypothetical protein WD995_01755 [Gemmatimonadota bacterium]
MDERLVGRTYAIPFDRVWNASRALADGRLRGWRLLRGDDREGVLEASSLTFLRRNLDEIVVTIRLDENAQTRVDVQCRRVDRNKPPRRHPRVIGRFFRALDRKLEAKARDRIDPTRVPAWLGGDDTRSGTAILLLPALLALASACGAPDAEVQPSPEESAAETTPSRVLDRVYERGFAFVSEREDSLLIVPWLLSSETHADSVQRDARGWLARGGTWEPFYRERWSTPPTRAPERILPYRNLDLLVRDGDVIDGLIFQDGPRSLEVLMGDALAAWVGPSGETIDVLEGAAYLSDERIDGQVVDISRSWGLDDPGAGDWVFLISGDSIRMVLAADVEHGLEREPVYRAWIQRGTEDLLWPEVRVTWSDSQAFPPARRDVPTRWTVTSADGTFGGTLESVTAELEAGEGTGPLLPVRALIEVEGVFSADGGRFPVRGLVLHQRR